MKAIADEAFGTLIAVMRGDVRRYSRERMGAAAMVRTEICGPVSKLPYTAPTKPDDGGEALLAKIKELASPGPIDPKSGALPQPPQEPAQPVSVPAAMAATPAEQQQAREEAVREEARAEARAAASANREQPAVGPIRGEGWQRSGSGRGPDDDGTGRKRRW